MAIVVLCIMCLQGCQFNAQVPSKGAAPENSHEASNDESASSCAQSLHSPVVFGSQQWSQYFGEVGTEPSLPPDISDILNSPCPFWPDRQVKDTHLLALVPATVDGKPFSLDLLGELVQHPKGGGCSTKYQRNYTPSTVQDQCGSQSPQASYWVLVTRDVIEDSKNRDYAYQQALVAQHATRTGLPYELPGVLEAATAILSHYARSGERLYAGVPRTYTRCQELVMWAGSGSAATIGDFSSEGLNVSRGGDDCDSRGVSCLRKF
jgi:hypothetical protein